jgi:hypothetical protein
MHHLLSDPWVAAQIDAAVAPFRGRLPAAELEFVREQLAEILDSDERASRLLARVRPRSVEESGETLLGGAVDGPPRRRIGAGE